MLDIYFKNPDDSSYSETELDTDSELDNLLAQIKMMIFTNSGNVLGAPDLGLNIEQLIFETNYNKFTILNIIKNHQLNYLKYDRQRYRVDFDLEFIQGTVRDIGVLNIKINGQSLLDIFVR